MKQRLPCVPNFSSPCIFEMVFCTLWINIVKWRLSISWEYKISGQAILINIVSRQTNYLNMATNEMIPSEDCSAISFHKIYCFKYILLCLRFLLEFETRNLYFLHGNRCREVIYHLYDMMKMKILWMYKIEVKASVKAYNKI